MLATQVLKVDLMAWLKWCWGMRLITSDINEGDLQFDVLRFNASASSKISKIPEDRADAKDPSSDTSE